VTKATRSPNDQCRANVLAWLAYRGANTGELTRWRLFPDRCFFPRDPFREAVFARLCSEGILERRDASNHGPDVIVGYRECVPRCAAQIVIHRDEIEFDFDEWQPWDLRGVLCHGWEILRHKVTGTKTDPFVIARKLTERGIYGRST